MVSFRLDKSFLAFFNLRRDEKTHYLVSQAITVPASQFAVISLAFVIEKVLHTFSLFSAESPLILTIITKAKLKKISIETVRVQFLIIYSELLPLVYHYFLN